MQSDFYYANIHVLACSQCVYEPIKTYIKAQRKGNIKFIRQSLSLFPHAPLPFLFSFRNQRASLYVDSWRWSFLSLSSSSSSLADHNRKLWTVFCIRISHIAIVLYHLVDRPLSAYHMHSSRCGYQWACPYRNISK